jgi:hypothetical protein
MLLVWHREHESILVPTRLGYLERALPISSLLAEAFGARDKVKTAASRNKLPVKIRAFFAV